VRIALDISSAARPDATGVAMYIRRMVDAFAKEGSAHQFTLVTRGSRIKNLFHRPSLPTPNFSSKVMFEGIHPFFGGEMDIFHGLDARLPGPWMKAQTVVTIHDVFSAVSSQFATDDFRAMKNKRYMELIERADRIVCVSECVKRDVISALKADPQKLRVVYEAGGEGFWPRSENDVAAVRQKYNLPAPYLLFVGSINKRKNIPAMVEAFAAAQSQLKSDLHFAIAGRIGYGGEEIRAQIEKSGCAKRVHILGYVPDADVPTLYSGAYALLFATLYEGFGIPAIEAFACGCPVIGSNVGSLPEIIGDAGLLVDPQSVDSIAHQIVQLSEPQVRRSLSEKGLLRAELFSWQKAATECLSIYQELLR